MVLEKFDNIPEIILNIKNNANKCVLYNASQSLMSKALLHQLSQQQIIKYFVQNITYSKLFAYFEDHQELIPKLLWSTAEPTNEPFLNRIIRFGAGKKYYIF